MPRGRLGQNRLERIPCGNGRAQLFNVLVVLAGNRLYVASQNADVFVLRAGPKFDLLATNSIGGEPMIASLAVSDGDILIRTARTCGASARLVAEAESPFIFPRGYPTHPANRHPKNSAR